MMTRKGCLLLTAFLALAPMAFGQRYSDWRIYRAADGMPESPCVSVTAGFNEKVLAKHINADAISELNGYSITSFASPELGRNRVYESSGGQLWTVTADGLEEFRDDAWRLHAIPEIARLVNTVSPLATPPIPIHVVRQGRVLILLPDQLAELNVEKSSEPRLLLLQSASQTGLQKFLGMTIARDGSLWISGARGLEHSTTSVRNLKAGEEWREFLTPKTLQAENFQEPYQDAETDGLTCVAESSSLEQRLAVHFDGTNWTAQPIGTQKIRGVWRGAEGVTWAVNLNTIFQIDNNETGTAETEEISRGNYFDVAVQTNGIFWVASAEGLLRYSPPLWKSPRAIQRLNSPVPCMAEDAESRLWFVSAGALHSLENQNHQEHGFPRNLRLVLQSARVLLPLKNGDLLLDNGEQLSQYHPPPGDTLNSLPSSAGLKQHTLGIFRDGTVAVESTDALQKCRFEKYDGISFQPFPAAPPDCAYSAFLETQNGDLWLGGEHGPICYHDKKWQTFTNDFVPSPIVCFVETTAGKIWCATPDAVWELTGQTWSTVRSGFDQINSMIRSHDGNIWVASNGGVHRFVQDAWVENSIEEGLPNATARRVYEDRRGRVWVGTTRGLTLFHPEADPDPPQTRIDRQPKENSIPQNTTVSLFFNGQDKWKYTPKDRLLYSHRLDQHDWSQFLDADRVSYFDLPAGPHSLEVRAMDRNGNIEVKPARMTFSVALPWYKETRLVLISFIGMITALFFAALAFNRHRKLLLSYAEVEKKVAERTHELEITSRELVHSQKMNALGTLAAGIAHDFNNILSIIKGSAQIIEDNVDNSEKVRVRVDRIKTVVEQGAGIVKAMLGFSGGSSDEPALCDLNTVVSDTIQLLGDRFQRDAAVIFKPVPGLPQVPVVKEFVQQIILNFVFNAAEAETAARRRQIILSIRSAQRLPEHLALAPATANEYILISVQDFGCGILPENLPRIFEPFFTTKALSARRGTGLGLSMVYELARKLEAGLSVDSIVDVGSTFTLIIPVRAYEKIDPVK
jgi:signal transduction histidine kinase/ligand-binding sensor domain-containing protein